MARMPLKSLLLLLPLLAVVGCGKYDRIEDGGFTDVSFGTGFQKNYVVSSTLTYGIVIFAYSANYATNIKISDATAAGSALMRLPNGEYTFYAFGYGQSIDAFGSNDVRCAVSGPIGLNGAGQTIHLDFRQSNCSNGAFSESSSFLDNTTSTVPNSGLHFRQLQVVHCSTGANTQLLGIAATGDCSTGGSGISAPWTAISSFQFVVPLYKRAGDALTTTGEAFRSACANGQAGFMGGASVSSVLRFPVGASAYPGLFPLEVESFSEASCTSSPVAKHSFHKGLIFGPSPGSSELGKALANTSVNKVRLFLRQP